MTSIKTQFMVDEATDITTTLHSLRYWIDVYLSAEDDEAAKHAREFITLRADQFRTKSGAALYPARTIETSDISDYGDWMSRTFKTTDRSIRLTANPFTTAPNGSNRYDIDGKWEVTGETYSRFVTNHEYIGRMFAGTKKECRDFMESYNRIP